MISKQIIQQAANRLADTFHPDRIILFGSYARGTADRHSDVDFLVITDDVKRKNRTKMMTEMASALDDLGFSKDIVIVTPEEFEVDKDIPGTIARYVSKEGKLLYERKRQRGKKENSRMVAVR